MIFFFEGFFLNFELDLNLFNDLRPPLMKLVMRSAVFVL